MIRLKRAWGYRTLSRVALLEPCFCVCVLTVSSVEGSRRRSSLKVPVTWSSLAWIVYPFVCTHPRLRSPDHTCLVEASTR